jgi:hypothetical protein
VPNVRYNDRIEYIFKILKWKNLPPEIIESIEEFYLNDFHLIPINKKTLAFTCCDTIFRTRKSIENHALTCKNEKLQLFVNTPCPGITSYYVYNNLSCRIFCSEHGFHTCKRLQYDGESGFICCGKEMDYIYFQTNIVLEGKKYDSLVLSVKKSEYDPDSLVLSEKKSEYDPDSLVLSEHQCSKCGNLIKKCLICNKPLNNLSLTNHRVCFNRVIHTKNKCKKCFGIGSICLCKYYNLAYRLYQKMGFYKSPVQLYINNYASKSTNTDSYKSSK